MWSYLSEIFSSGSGSNTMAGKSETLQAPKIEQPPLAKHDSSVLNLAFVMDCTGSMGSYIKSATDNIRKIVEEVVSSEKSDVQLALVEYRDHPPQDSSFVTRPHDFTPKIGQMKGWLERCSASGGGDGPEAVADGLHQLLKLSWRSEATKIGVLISDAPPHGLGGGGDGFPNGCPDGLDPLEITSQLAAKGITLYVVGCEPSIISYKDFFMGLAYMTGGQYVPLASAHALTQVIIGGAQEEISLDQWMEEVNREVIAEVQARGAESFDEDALTRRVTEGMAYRGVQCQQLTRNNAGLGEATEMSKKVANMQSLSDWRAENPASGGFMAQMFSPACPPPPTKACATMFSGASLSSGGVPAPPPPPMARAMAASYPGFSFSPPMAASSSNHASTDDVYGVEERTIQYSQVQRLVQKSKMRNVNLFQK